MGNPELNNLTGKITVVLLTRLLTPSSSINDCGMREKLRLKPRKQRLLPGRINPRGNTHRLIVVKLTKIKDKVIILKATRERQQFIS